MVQKTPSAADQIIIPSADHVALVVKAGSNAFISNLFEARDNSNNIKFYVDKSGNINAQGYSYQGTDLLTGAIWTTQSPGDSTTKVATTAFVQTALGSALPSGSIISYGASTAPSGYLLCQGQAVSRTTYAALFSAIGTSWGSGDGSTTFNVPDLQGRTIVGLAGASGHTDVKTLGLNDGAALANRRPKHNHTNSVSASHNLTLPNHVHSATSSVSAQYWGVDNAATDVNVLSYNGSSSGFGAPSDTTVSTSVGNPTSNPSITGSVSIGGTIGPSGTNPTDAPSYLVVNYIIKT